MITASIQSSGNDALEEVLACIKELVSYEVLVGVPEGSRKQKQKLSSDGPRSREKRKLSKRKFKKQKPKWVPTNAQLAYIHTYGSGRHHIPARPFLEPAIENGKEEIGLLMEDAVVAALDGDAAGLQKALGEAGQRGQSLAQKFLENYPANGLAKNAPITIEGGEMHNYKNGALFTIKPKKSGASSKPLIDTNELLKSISYSVEKK